MQTYNVKLILAEGEHVKIVTESNPVLAIMFALEDMPEPKDNFAIIVKVEK